MNVAEGTIALMKSFRGFKPSHVGRAWTSDVKHQRTPKRQSANLDNIRVETDDHGPNTVLYYEPYDDVPRLPFRFPELWAKLLSETRLTVSICLKLIRRVSCDREISPKDRTQCSSFAADQAFVCRLRPAVSTPKPARLGVQTGNRIPHLHPVFQHQEAHQDRGQAHHLAPGGPKILHGPTVVILPLPHAIFDGQQQRMLRSHLLATQSQAHHPTLVFGRGNMIPREKKAPQCVSWSRMCFPGG